METVFIIGGVIVALGAIKYLDTGHAKNPWAVAGLSVVAVAGFSIPMFVISA